MNNSEKRTVELSGALVTIFALIIGILGMYEAHAHKFACTFKLFLGWTIIEILNDRLPAHFFGKKDTAFEFALETLNDVVVIGIILPMFVYVYLGAPLQSLMTVGCLFFSLSVSYRELQILSLHLQDRTEFVGDGYFLGMPCPMNAGFFLAPLFFEQFGVPLPFSLQTCVTIMLFFGGIMANLPIPTYSLASFGPKNKMSLAIFGGWLALVLYVCFQNFAYGWILFLGVYLISIPFSIKTYLDEQREMNTKQLK